MKKITSILGMLVALSSIASAQLDVIRYSICTDCPSEENQAQHGVTYTYQLETDYTPMEVTSDYGPRNLRQYDWHNGIDLRPHPGGLVIFIVGRRSSLWKQG